MAAQHSRKSDAESAIADADTQDSGRSSPNAGVETPMTTSTETVDAMSLLSRHKGKLAVGAAAMLGLAVFYHWRESKLAKDDEEEYARLQRIKAALHVNE